MPGRVIPLRRPQTVDRRLDALAEALTPRGPQKSFLDAQADCGAVRIDIGALEIWSTPEEAREFARHAIAAADEAERGDGC